jgi:spore germination protein YaaH
MRSLVATLLGTGTLCAALPAAAQEKVHALEAEAQAGAPDPAPERGPGIRRSAPTRRLTRKVFGYYPYWASGWQNLRFELLSTLAYFASALSEEGRITQSHGWGGDAVGALVRTAQAAGVRVVQTFTLFDNAGIGRLLASAERRTEAIRNIIDEVKRGGGEGANIDFEFVPAAQKASFVTFMRDLTEAMHREIPGSEVTLATPAVDWSGAYDYDQLAIHTDGMMIMAYGFHWTGGPPGPLAPLTVAPPWTGRSLTWTLDDYERYGGRENRSKFILGLPFYGNDWPTTSDEVPGQSRGTGHAVVYRNAVDKAAEHGRRWDDITKTPYYVYQTGDGWHQTWYDDAESLAHKLDLINQRDIGGLGIWALSYDGYRPDLFDVIEEKLSEAVTAPDAGTSPDDGGAGAPDGGVGGPDGGAPAPDAGAPGPDGGPGPRPAPQAAGGCQAAGGAGNLALVAFFLVLLFAAARFR